MAVSEEPHDAPYTETSPGDRYSIHACLDQGQTHAPKMVTVRVKDVIDALVGISNVRPLWLSDFQDDPISITEDMYEVLVAYRTMRRAA
jgi:hypothetical protein